MAEPTIQIEYHQGLEALEALLAGVKRPGDFYVHGTLEVPLPLVEVDGTGVLSFPLPDAQVRELIAQASLAPYGRGEETLLDTSVRKVWQIAPEKVRIGGKSWPQTFEDILSRVSAGLGCKRSVVSAELYKLLVYDRGSFFVSHRDTEKAEGMFGTLVIGLPSAHRGGELVLRHGRRHVTVDTSQVEFSELSFAAFYADCEHEVRPITEGNRVCLVYNLIQKPSKQRGRQPLSAPDYETETSAARAMVLEAMTAPDAPAKLAWLLEHHYSPAGLSFAGLKNADAALAGVLSQAAREAGCDVHLAMVHIEESGSAELGYDSYRSSRGRWSRESHDTDSESYEVIEVSESSQAVDEWVDSQDQRVAIGRIPLAGGELLPQGSLDDEEPDEQRVSEATGNEGASFERSYHRAALVLWRRERYGDVLLQAGVGAAFPLLKELFSRTRAAAASEADRREAMAFAARVIDAWTATQPYSWYGRREELPARSAMLNELLRLGDVDLLGRFLSDVVTRDYDGSENQTLTAAAKALESGKFGPLFATLVTRKMPSAPRECIGLLSRLIEAQGTHPEKPWLDGVHETCAAAVAGLEKVGDPEAIEPHLRWRRQGPEAVLDGATLADLFASLASIRARDLEEAAVAILCARPAVFDPNAVLVPALVVLRKREKGGNKPSLTDIRLWTHAAEFLLARSEAPPEPPKDWRQDVQLKCRCEDCRELEVFARDGSSQVHRFRVREDRRVHLKHVIESSRLDMSNVTEQTGSPHTLVCTKNRRSHLERLKQYQEDIASMTALASLADESPREVAALAGRIQAAVGRARG
jgi:hypothetical protein